MSKINKNKYNIKTQKLPVVEVEDTESDTETDEENEVPPSTTKIWPTLTTKYNKKDEEDDDDFGDPDSKQRWFKCVYGDETFGRFAGKKPKQASSKALTNIIKKIKDTGAAVPQEGVVFQMKEVTRGRKKKMFEYTGKQVELTHPIHIQIKDGTGHHKAISYKHKNFVKKTKTLNALPLPKIEGGMKNKSKKSKKNKNNTNKNKEDAELKLEELKLKLNKEKLKFEEDRQHLENEISKVEKKLDKNKTDVNKNATADKLNFAEVKLIKQEKAKEKAEAMEKEAVVNNASGTVIVI